MSNFIILSLLDHTSSEVAIRKDLIIRLWKNGNTTHVYYLSTPKSTTTLDITVAKPLEEVLKLLDTTKSLP